MELNHALVLRSVGKTFNAGQWNEVRAVGDVNLAFGWGESVLLVGENGSGKSTLMNLVDGSVRLSSGKVEIDGVDVSGWPAFRRYRRIHRVHQDPSLGMAPFATVAENLAVASRKKLSMFDVKGLFCKRDLESFARVVARVNPDMAEKLHQKVYRLSPGQRQALALAMLAMRSGERRILLADEPTAALDPATAEICLEMISAKVAEGWLLLHITHNPSLIAGHSGRIVTMQEGKVVSDVSA